MMSQRDVSASKSQPLSAGVVFLRSGALSVLVLLLASHAFAEFTTVLNVPPDPAPDQIGSDTQLNLFEGGALPDLFHAGAPDGSSSNVQVNIIGGSVGKGFGASRGSTVNISGGSVGDGMFADNSTIVLTGGSVGYRFTVSYSGVTISGGSVGDLFRVWWGSNVNITGGLFGDFFTASRGSGVTISGGSIDDRFTAGGASFVTISGGTFGDSFGAYRSSEISLFGREFFLDGLPLEELTHPGDSLILESRDGRQLSGTFLDGNSFEFDLNESATGTEDYFDPEATLRLTLAVPEPAALPLMAFTTMCARVVAVRRASSRRALLD